jgi:hypothetical protein
MDDEGAVAAALVDVVAAGEMSGGWYSISGIVRQPERDKAMAVEVSRAGVFIGVFIGWFF